MFSFFQVIFSWGERERLAVCHHCAMDDEDYGFEEGEDDVEDEE